MKEGYDSLARPHLEFMQSFSVKSQRERSAPDSDGGQVPEPEGSTKQACFLPPKARKVGSGKKTDRPALFVSGA